MSYPYYPTTHPYQAMSTGQAYSYSRDPSLSSTLAMAGTGAMIAGSGAAATNLHRLQAGSVDPRGALANTLHVALAGAVAAGTASAVAGWVGGGTTTRATVSVLAGTAVMYLLNAPREET